MQNERETKLFFMFCIQYIYIYLNKPRHAFCLNKYNYSISNTVIHSFIERPFIEYNREETNNYIQIDKEIIQNKRLYIDLYSMSA